MSKSLTQNSRIIAKKGTFQGREVLAFFVVAEGADGYSVRLVGVRQLEADVVVLSEAKTKDASVVSMQSPYFPTLEFLTPDFSFLTSQSARAPSL